MSDFRVYIFAIDTGDVPVTGLTLSDFTVNIDRILKTDGTSASVVSSADMGFEVGNGVYGYIYSSADYTLYDYSSVVTYDGAETLSSTVWVGMSDSIVGVSTEETADIGAGLTLTEILAAMRLELSDSGTFFSDSELTRGVHKTVDLLSRFIPDRNIAETRIGGSVTSETLTISDSTGTLAYPPIKPGTLTITGEVEGTDYEINYLTGVVTEVGSGLADGNYTASYSRDPRIYKFSSLVSNYVGIERLEYPVGDNPITNPAFDVVGDYIIVKGKDSDLSEDEHMRIIYTVRWSYPTADAASNYLPHMDSVVIIGSCGQSLIFKAEKYVQQAITEIELANAAADSMATPLADINTALDKVNTYLVTNGTTDNAADVLANITDDVLTLRTNVSTMQALYSTYVTNGSTAPDAKKYLDDGDAIINTAFRGKDASMTYVEYAKASLELYQHLLNNAAISIENIRTYVEESEEWRKIGETFVAEATQRIQEVYAWSMQAQQYFTTSKQYLDIAGRYLASGQAKINEFLVSIGQKPEYYSYKMASSQFA